MAGTELFKVTCLTCQAKLSVRNPALVDQIVACPKCNSMVHVVPPAPAAPAPTPVAASAAPLAKPAAAAMPEFDTAADDPTADIPPPEESPLQEPSDVPPETSSVLTSTSNTSFILWSVASLVIGITVMGTLLMLRGGGAADEAPINGAPAVPTAAQQADHTRDSVTTAAATAEPPAPTPSPGLADDVVVPEGDAPAQAETSAPEPAEPTLLGPVELPDDDLMAQDPAEPLAEPRSEAKLIIARADPPKPAPDFDPLAIDPSELDLATITEGTDVASQQDDQPVAADDETPEAEPMSASVPVRLDSKSHPASATRIASVQIRNEVPSVSVSGMPLLDFFAFAGELAGVPISVAPEQLQMAGVTPGRPVAIDASDVSLADLLQTVLDPLHLEAVADGPHIVVVRQGNSRVRRVEYPIDDLLGSDVTAQGMGEWIQTLIAPESWQAAGGDATIVASSNSLSVEHTQGVQYQILFLLERVRLAKGLPLRSKYPARLLAPKPYHVGIADRLAAPATFTFSHNTPLAEVFRYWQGEAGLPVFVDWPALADVGRWPDSRVTCTITNEPWHVALDKILGPLNLAWRAAPGGGIQITSRAKAETEPVLEIFPAGAWRGDATNAVVVDDPVNELTYVRAPASVLTPSAR